jgi:hypothetical protein
MNAGRWSRWLARASSFAYARAGAFYWLAYGGLAALVFNGALRSHAPHAISCQRYNDLTNAVQALNHGLPPLLAVQPGSGGGFYPAGYTDDVGPVLYLARLGHLIGTTDPYTIYRVAFVGLWTVPLVLWPLLFSRIFKSRLAGLLAPVLLVLLVITDANIAQSYWFPGWAVAVCLPILMLAVTRASSARPDRRTWLSIAAVVVIAGFAQTMRSPAGYGIALSAAGLGVVLASNWRRRILVGVLILGGFWVASSGVVDLAVAYRNSIDGNKPLSRNFTAVYGGTNVSSLSFTSHPLWHTLYIGLGFDPNRYGIYYNDNAGYSYVKSVNPNIKPISPAYSAALEKRYFHLLSSDPGFVLGGYLHKGAITLHMAVRSSWALLILLPFALLASVRRRRLRRWLALFAPSLLILFLVPTLVVPFNGYQFGFLQSVRVLEMVLICWCVAGLELAATRRTDPNVPSFLERVVGRVGHYIPIQAAPYQYTPETAPLRPATVLNRLRAGARTLGIGPWRAAAVTIIVVVAELAGAFGSSAVAAREQTQVEYPRVSLGELQELAPSSHVVRWTASMTGIPDWAPVNGARLVPPGNSRPGPIAAVILTSSARYAFELNGPTFTLPPGAYQLYIAGSVRRRALAAVAVDATTNETVALSQPYGPQTSKGIGLYFTLATQRTIRLILTNSGGAAEWMIRYIEFGRAQTTGVTDNVRSTASGCAVVANGVPAHSSSVSLPVGRTLYSWNPQRLKRAWQAQAGTTVSRSGSLLLVRTSSAPYGYQLASQVLGLRPGSYLLQVTGVIPSGGTELIADVPGVQTILGSRIFGRGLPGQPPIGMTMPFTVPENEAVQFVLANATYAGSARTTWRIARVTLMRVH